MSREDLYDASSCINVTSLSRTYDHRDRSSMNSKVKWGDLDKLSWWSSVHMGSKRIHVVRRSC